MKTIFIMTDTQRADMLGCSGNQSLATPHLDRLASEGVRFSSACTCSPVCGPARSALFTGQYPHQNGSWANGMPLHADARTLGQRLDAHGIHCAYIGKWHLDGWDYFGDGRCPEGWDPDVWYDMRNYLDELPEHERPLTRRTDFPSQPGFAPEKTFGHRCASRAVDFIEKHREEDYFLSVSFDEPHHPFPHEAQDYEHYRDFRWQPGPNALDSLDGKPGHQRIWAEECQVGDLSAGLAFPEFFASNTFVDRQIGRVLDAIDRHAPDALVIYTSDHGDMLGSHRLMGKGPVAYDEVTRIPMLVRWPGHMEGGRVCEAPVSHIDLVPTVLAAHGIESPPACTGIDLCSPHPDPRREVFFEYHRFETDHDGFGGYQPYRAVTDGRWKLCLHLQSSDELYDLTSDPHELHNRIADDTCIEDRNRLHDALLNWMNETRDPFRGYDWALRPWRTDREPARWACDGFTRQPRPEPGQPTQLDYETGLPCHPHVRPK